MTIHVEIPVILLTELLEKAVSDAFSRQTRDPELSQRLNGMIARATKATINQTLPRFDALIAAKVEEMVDAVIKEAVRDALAVRVKRAVKEALKETNEKA